MASRASPSPSAWCLSGLLPLAQGVAAGDPRPYVARPFEDVTRMRFTGTETYVATEDLKVAVNAAITANVSSHIPHLELLKVWLEACQRQGR